MEDAGINSLGELDSDYRRILMDRFNEKIKAPSDPNSCILWQGSRTDGDYGHFRVRLEPGRNVLVLAHWLSFLIFNGDIPEGAFILHSCHNRLCLNPDHLRAGTHQENMDEMVSAGRQNKARGSRAGRAKLTEDQVAEILETEGSHAGLARAYGVSASTIRQIRTGNIWKHVERTTEGG